MAYLAASDVNVDLNPEDIDRSPDGRIGIRTFPTVRYGDAALQYPALGIPMPAIGKFGFHFAIKRAYIEQPANGFIYHFDRANHKLRIFLGAARDAITVANHVGVVPTGNVSAPTFTGDAVAPTGNVAAPTFTGDAVAPTGNVSAPAFTGDAVSPGTPTGNLANLAAASHTHDLIIAGNGSHTFDVDIGLVEANSALSSNVANAITVPGNIAANGGIANVTPANGTGDFVGDAMANITPTGNVAAPTFTGDAVAPTGNVSAPAFTGDAVAPTGNVSAPTFTGDAPANFIHVVTGGGAVAEAPLAEMDDGVAPAATTLYMEMVGR